MSIILFACASNGKQWNPDDYTVKSGDTVYSLAWRYELDPEDFAAWNKIRASSFIKPGQRLHTRKPANFRPSQALSDSDYSEENDDKNIAYVPDSSSAADRSYAGRKWVKAKKGDSLYAISKKSNVSIERLAQLNQLKKPYVIQPGQTIFLKPLTTKTFDTDTGKPVTAVSASANSKKFRWPSTVKWKRPAKGKVIKKFKRNQNNAKGIDIAGTLGEKILASAGGRVVYSGDGLISYGNLIIIKHNKTYLSAYAYNHKLLVKEGDEVKAGQKIAEMGRKDKLSPRLHFEIRKNGKPVDPLKYLPW